MIILILLTIINFTESAISINGKTTLSDSLLGIVEKEIGEIDLIFKYNDEPGGLRGEGDGIDIIDLGFVYRILELYQ